LVNGVFFKTMKSSIERLYSLFQKHPQLDTDSRNIKAGSIFFALKGENFNGNKFANNAIEKGAAYAVVDEEEFCTNDKIILVDDVLKTLQKLATTHISILNIPVIAITGTNGKTTTKELVNAVLSTKYNTNATRGNLNNHIGVPLTLLSCDSNTEILITEMGANHPGEIADLCQIAQPSFGIITNIGKAHLEGFGGEEGVIKTKSELYQHLERSDGKAFVNADDKLLCELSRNLDRIFYGSGREAKISGEILEVNPFVKLQWEITDTPCENKMRKYSINSKLIGEYNFYNILAAIAVGSYFEIEPQSIMDAVEGYIPVNNRSQIIKKEEKTIILDAYNANPSNMEAAINNLIKMKADKKAAIIGDMLELGKYSSQEHKRIYDLLKDGLVDKLIFVGSIFSGIVNDDDICFIDTDTAITWLKNNKIDASLILIKASRGIGLEKIVSIL
jgi:UDP-N-acetylmuramoyl-tripeptide--D-alanyl-D-alanine ligase